MSQQDGAVQLPAGTPADAYYIKACGAVEVILGRTKIQPFNTRLLRRRQSVNLTGQPLCYLCEQTLVTHESIAPPLFPYAKIKIFIVIHPDKQFGRFGFVGRQAIDVTDNS